MILEPNQRPELSGKTKDSYNQFERLILEIRKTEQANHKLFLGGCVLEF